MQQVGKEALPEKKDLSGIPRAEEKSHVMAIEGIHVKSP